MYYFKVMELYSLGSHQPSYGILASVLESNACTYVACVPDISCDRCFVEELAHRCNEGQLSPMPLFVVVVDAVFLFFLPRGGVITHAPAHLLPSCICCLHLKEFSF